jgi:transcriptional regulator with XRE-family HTH domain
LSVLFDNLIVMGNEGDRRIGKRVAEWRGRRGLSQAQLAGFVEGLTQPKLSQVEKGNRRLTTVELAEISNALGVDPLDLLDDEPMSEGILVAARAGAGASTAEAVDVAVDTLRVLKMLHEDGFSAGLGVRPTIPDVPKGRGPNAASFVREFASLGTGPIDDLVAVCAVFGLAVSYRPFAADFDGVCAAQRGQAVAVINTAGRRNGRQRFTLAHELGHWLFGDVDDDAMIDEDIFDVHSTRERLANDFAANLLLPALVAQRIDSVATATRVAYEFQISLSAVSWRVENASRDSNLAAKIRAVSPLQAAQDAGCELGYRDDADALDSAGVTVGFEVAARAALEAGALSERRLESVLPGLTESKF